MRRAFLGGAAGLLACALVPGWAAQPASAPEPAWQAAGLPQARQLDLSSTRTGHRYRIFISVPETAAPAGGHPVMYVLDGNAAFPSAALMARTVARRSKATGLHAPVVVGIGYASGEDFDMAARARDYTPPAAGKAAKGEGGADLFLDFIEQELKPLIQAAVSIDPQRQALFGHSYGGLFTLHALFTRPAAFQTYIAASPSIWFSERFVLSEAAGLAASRKHKPQVLLTVGELEQSAGPPTARPNERNAALAQKKMVDEARDLAAKLEAQKQALGLARVGFIELPRENHGSALFPALSRGLEFFLER
ncbi:alpha/beta hydrolase [Duganella sp. HH105]|uniref:alpha/beta hydrolase n=1 Tax=Duganella sp. HH105 TaxID=1781067 RepID=UPI000877D15D|nr:alpha/beta hydrolase-fold protein [Duganella sp. HH105]OEZ63807.1 ferri-bacillibactin esterase BesA [Duganella sp. HH105]